MSTQALIVIVLVAVWLGILTVVIVLLVRQIGLLTIRFDQLDLVVPTFRPENDGPLMGEAISPEVTLALPELATDPTYLLLLSATCTPCRGLAQGLKRTRIEKMRNVVALVPGHEALADSLIASLPVEMRSIRDPVATAIANGLHIEGAPFALLAMEGAVVAKAHLSLLRQPEDVAAFIKNNGPSYIGEANHMEVVGHGG